jgi:hypothetical protein
MINSNYNCTQTELYKACRFIWLLCQQYLTAFADYKVNYTAAYIAENLALIQTVESSDDHDARTTPVKDLRKEFLAERTDAIDFWKQLKGYCETAFKGDTVLRDAMYGEAGQGYYDKITGGSWSEVAGLLSAMIPFVQNRKDVLMQKGFMPASFLTRLEENQTGFAAAYQTWKTQNETVSPATETRIIANNDLKNRAMEVLADGQRALIKDKANAQKFVWSAILTEIRGPKPTGLAGKVTDVATKGGIANATVTIVELNLTATTDKDGRYEFTVLSEGSYTIDIKATGYQTLVVEKRAVKGGMKGRLNGEMTAG